MKQQIKNKLFHLGFLPKLDLIRRLPEVRNWIVNGCSGIAPPR